MDIYFAKVYQWLEETKNLAPQVCDWIGIYYKENYLHQIESTDLIIGPYIGEETEHIRIPLNRGFCGMALREEKTVNVDDVNADDRHIACSLKTKSELVVPIADRKGRFVAELDIDCNQLKAFSPELQKLFEEQVKSFPLLEEMIPFQVKSFETERLVLRQINSSDLHDLFSYCSNPNVARFVTWEPHQSIQDTKKLIAYAESSYAKGMPEPMGIVLKNDPQKRVIGTVGLIAVSPKNRTFELAYALDEQHWGKGYIVEAANVLIDFAFKHYAINRLQCRCKEENLQSSRVMEKLGMQYEGLLRASMFNKNITSHMKMYSILKSEFQLST